MIRTNRHQPGVPNELPCGCVLEWKEGEEGTCALTGVKTRAAPYLASVARTCKKMRGVSIDDAANTPKWLTHIRKGNRK